MKARSGQLGHEEQVGEPGQVEVTGVGLGAPQLVDELLVRRHRVPGAQQPATRHDVGNLELDAPTGLEQPRPFVEARRGGGPG